MKTKRQLISCVILVLVLAGTGCQTFTLTDEEFAKQQKGGVVDREVGGAVGVLGTGAYFGSMIGAAAAGVK